MRNVVTSLTAALRAAWVGFVSWWFGFAMPKPAVEPPRPILTPDTEE